MCDWISLTTVTHLLSSESAAACPVGSQPGGTIGPSGRLSGELVLAGWDNTSSLFQTVPRVQLLGTGVLSIAHACTEKAQHARPDVLLSVQLVHHVPSFPKFELSILTRLSRFTVGLWFGSVFRISDGPTGLRRLLSGAFCPPAALPHLLSPLFVSLRPPAAAAAGSSSEPLDKPPPPRSPLPFPSKHMLINTLWAVYQLLMTWFSNRPL